MKVYVDLDGVLADFIGSACALHGVPISDLPAGKWDVIEDLCKIKNISQNTFWNGLGSKFWASILPTPECFDLIHDLSFHFGLENIKICSSPSNGDSLKGKHEWVKSHFPSIMKHRNYHYCYHKEELASPNRILIDDKIENCHLFHANGGKTIVWPNHWNNYNDCENVHAKLSYLRNEIKKQGLQ